jgi:D-tyrosyl-tRNA(Tyr) deacylase
MSALSPKADSCGAATDVGYAPIADIAGTIVRDTDCHGETYWRQEMKGLITVLVALAAVTTADAKGCLKGAAVGGVAGHYAGHHGLLGAAAGCAIGRHEANKRDRVQREQSVQPNRDLRNGEEHL